MAVAAANPVFLTRSAPFSVCSDHLVFYDVVGPSVISRSSVLSSVLEAGGDVQLPESVTLENFKAYISYTWAIQVASCSFSGLTFPAMCGVIQVR